MKKIFTIDKIIVALFTALMFAGVFALSKIAGGSKMDALTVLLFVLYIHYFADKIREDE